VPLADTHQRALAVIDAIMMKQASMQAYNDAWLLPAPVLHLRRARGVPAEEAEGARGGRGRALDRFSIVWHPADRARPT